MNNTVVAIKIRPNNVPLNDTSECDTTVLDILNNALPVGQSVSPGDIDRCHPIGKHNKKNNRQEIEKFVSYKLKALLYDARFRLSNIYMTEDFTSENQKLVDKLTQFKRAKKIKSYWSYDGKLYATAHEAQPKMRINCVEDTSKLISAAIDDGYIMEFVDNEGDADSSEMQQ